MGEEALLLSFSPQQKEEEKVEAAGAPPEEEEENQKVILGEEDQTLETQLDMDVVFPVHEDQTLEDCTISEKETIPEKDQEPGPIISQEIDGMSIMIQKIEDDGIIPSPVLKDIAIGSFSSPDLFSTLQLLGAKYNSLMKKNQEQCSKIETLEVNCETLRNKCLNECEPKYETLKKKYTQECSERKHLYNELIELKGNIRVFCRCRPLSSEEISKGYTSVLEFDPSQDMELQIICSDSSRKQFKFDHVFGPQDNQEAVFAETLPVVKSVLDGYNVCIFAYGQTGTGKTFTMEGNPENRGVNYRALEELFRSSKESSVMRYEFCVSMLEVYNEKLRDLLAENPDQPAKKLEIKQVADGSQDVPGLIEARAYNIDEVWEMLKTGGRNRSVGSTNANELSSRSHCLVRVTIKAENLVNGQRSRSHMWLVDLAGSERVGKTEVEGERLKESQFINKSLSALGDVISALASKNPHIPYRNSKLTHLLQSSLGGDCKTLMFAQISPSSADLGETLCSLNFASRVRGIEHGPMRKQSDPMESFKLKQMTEKLRQEEKETAKLNESLQLMHLKYASRENVFKTLQEKIRDAEQACRNYQMKVRDLESQLADEKKGRLQHDTRNSAHYKPPLAPIKERPPLGRITNRLPPSGPRRGSITTLSALADKENFMTKKNAANTGPIKPLMKARRISLTPLVRPIPVQPKRRASIAVLPSQRLATLPQTQQLHQIYSTPRLSKLRVQSSTPDGKGKFSSMASSSKYFSPPQMHALWRSKIPTVGSPRQRLRLVSSPASLSCLKSSEKFNNKLCFSVQKRLIVSSPAQSQPMYPGSAAINQGLRSSEVVGKFGIAQRVLCKNRRRSVM